MRTFPIQSRWVPRSTINVVYASQPLCSLPWRQLIPPNPPHQSPALRQVLPLLPFVGIGHQRFPKVKSCSWAQRAVPGLTHLSPALFPALCSALHITAEGKIQIASPRWILWKLSSSQRTDFIVPILQQTASKRSYLSVFPTWLASWCPLCWDASRPLCNTAQCTPSDKILPYNLFRLTQKIQL